MKSYSGKIGKHFSQARKNEIKMRKNARAHNIE